MKKMIVFLMLVFMVGAMTPPLAHAEEGGYKIKTMTPELRKALDQRRQRYKKLEQMKNLGHVGETHDGYVAQLSGGDEVEALVEEENEDRETIYRTIAEQNNLGSSIGVIEEIFARNQRSALQPGQKYQNDKGQWLTKE